MGKRLGRRRRMASSMSEMRFVAPRIRMRWGVEVPAWEEERPSQCVMNLSYKSVLHTNALQLVRRKKREGKYILCFNHSTGFMFTTSPCTEHSVNLVDEDDTGLQFSGEREHGVDEFVRIAVPFFREGGDV